MALKRPLSVDLYSQMNKIISNKEGKNINTESLLSNFYNSLGLCYWTSSKQNSRENIANYECRLYTTKT